MNKSYTKLLHNEGHSEPIMTARVTAFVLGMCELDLAGNIVTSGLERFSGGEIFNSGDFAEMAHTVVTAAASYLVDGPSSGRAVPSVHLISDRPRLSIAGVWQADRKAFLLSALRRHLMWHFHRQTTVYSKHRPRRSRDGSFFSLLRHLMLVGSVTEELARLVNLWKHLEVCSGLIKEVW